MQRSLHCLYWPLLLLDRLSYHARKMKTATKMVEGVRTTALEVVPAHVPADAMVAVQAIAMMDAQQIAGMDAIVGRSRFNVL